MSMLFGCQVQGGRFTTEAVTPLASGVKLWDTIWHRSKPIVPLLVWACLLFLGGVQSLSAQQFRAEASPRQVQVDDYIEVYFTLTNAEGTQFAPPSFNDFRVVSGPNRSVSTQIINGNYSQEASYGYVLMPKKAGTFTIGSASIMVKGKRMQTRPVQIQVSKQSAQQQADDSKPFFVKAIPNTRQVWVGQQIALDYKLYTQKNIDSYQIEEEPNYSGFYALDVPGFSIPGSQENVGGKRYTTKVLKRMALFPQQAGQQTVESMFLQLGVVQDETVGGFFLGNIVKQEGVKTQPVVLDVKALPANAPASFSGAVGQYEAQASIQNPHISTGDAVSLRLVIRGNGDNKQLLAPAISFPDGFEVYDPKVVQEESQPLNGEIQSVKVIDYVAIPQKAGDFTLTPAFSYFDPVTGSYEAVPLEPIAIQVVQGGGNDVYVPGSKGKESSTNRLADIYTQALGKPAKKWVGTPLFWILLVLPWLGIISLAGWKKRKQQIDSIDPVLLKQKKAREVALRHLQQSKAYLEQGDSRSFYDALAKALWGYTSDKLQLPTAELSRQHVHEKLQAAGVSPQEASNWVSLITTVETSLYAGKNQVTDLKGFFEQAQQSIESLENQLNLSNSTTTG